MLITDCVKCNVYTIATLKAVHFNNNTNNDSIVRHLVYCDDAEQLISGVSETEQKRLTEHNTRGHILRNTKHVTGN